MSRLADDTYNNYNQVSAPVKPFTLEVKWPGEDEEELTFQYMHELIEAALKLRKQSTYDNSVRLRAWDKNGTPLRVV